MSDTELVAEGRLRRAPDRHVFRWARAMTRGVLSGYAAALPRALEFSRGATGKPELRTTTERPLRFSLAHTPGIAVLVVSSGRAVGVDVESERRRTSRGLPRVLLAIREEERLEALLPAERQARILQHWTLTEAYAKACGRGLEFPLHDPEFRIDGSQITTRFGSHVDRERPRWWFSLPSTVPGFVLAVAAELHPERPAPPELQTFFAARLRPIDRSGPDQPAEASPSCDPVRT